MFAAILGYVLIFLSIYLQLYYWCGWTDMQSNKKINSICKVIVPRTFGIISCIIALITSKGNIYLYIAFAIGLALLIYDVWRLKWQIDETIK